MTIYRNIDFEGTQKEFVAGFLRGYRLWNISSPLTVEGPSLSSTSMTDFHWRPGRNEAHCGTLAIAQENIKSQGSCACSSCFGSPELAAERFEAAKRTLDALLVHQIPGKVEECTQCGFYAAHTADHLAIMMRRYFSSGDLLAGKVFGSIKATGRIVMGTKGFRAQYVEVEALCFDSIGAGHKVAQTVIADRYQVPVLSREELLEKYPPTPVEGITYDPVEGTTYDKVAIVATTSPPITSKSAGAITVYWSPMPYNYSSMTWAVVAPTVTDDDPTDTAE